MDKNKDGVVGDEQQQDTAAADAEAEAAFAAGVAKTSGAAASEGKPEETDATKVEADAAAKATADAEAKAKADADAKAAADKKAADDAAAKAAAEPWRGEFDKLNSSVTTQLRTLAGHIGSFKQTLDKISTTAQAAADKKGVDAPSKVEIAEALSDPDKWKQLEDDFPEWMKPVAAELTRLRKDMAAVAKSAGERPAPVVAPAPAAAAQVIDTAAIIADAEERAYVRMKHPDWKTICASPSFAKKDANGNLIGGWLATAPDDIKAKANSENGDDAVVVFDAYKAHQKKLADEEAAKERNKKRLATAVVVNGTTEPPQQGLDEEAAFAAGVKKTLGGKG